MRLTWRGIKAGQRTFLPFFCAGLVAGIVIMNIGKSILLGDTGLFDENTLYQMKYMTLDSNALFSYVFRKRIGSLLILAVLSTTYLGLAVCMGAAVWYGMSAGTLLAALSIRYGIKGILLALACVLPQYLIYVPAMLALLSWCEDIYRGIYTRGELRTGDKTYMFKKLGYLAAILLAAAVGCALEGYVNPYLLFGYLKIF